MTVGYNPAYPYSMRYKDLLRSNLLTLLDAFTEATGWKTTTCSRVVAMDPKFFTRLSDDDNRDFRVGTYDMIASRFSALWPDGLAWPEGIDRPEPADVEQETRDLVRARISPPERPIRDWPKGTPWPDDIPRPVAASTSPAGTE